ncbi:hypothetical protein LTR12_016330 [Friedmanniomyces endolithicus]|nr:hypothetical protein LTR12_016330 [Friedmanniomyces endolithicus]
MSTFLKRTDTIWPKAKRHTSSIDDELGAVRDPTVPQLHTNHDASEQKDDSSTSLPVPKPTQRPRIEELKPHVLSRAAGMRSHFRVPTAQSLNHSIVIIEKTVWDLYEAIAFCSNQGEDEPAGCTILSRRKRTHPHQDESLFVVKQHQSPLPEGIRHFVKPRSRFLVELHGAFHSGAHLWTLYEEMDLSLEQIFALDCDPWTICPGEKDAQISAIASQV